jgi:hypothetical protein
VIIDLNTDGSWSTLARHWNGITVRAAGLVLPFAVCDRAKAQAVEAGLRPLIPKLEGGPRAPIRRSSR